MGDSHAARGTGMNQQDDREAPRRLFMKAAATSMLASALPAHAALLPGLTGSADVQGTSHEAIKRLDGQNIRLALWRKMLKHATGRPRGTVLLVHGSSVSARPSFDLQVPGMPGYSLMDRFAREGFDAWCFDCEGYGRSDKSRPINADVETGAQDIAVVADYITKATGAAKLMIYGGSSGALRAGLYAQRRPERVSRLALEALVWTGEGSRTLAQRREKLEQWRSSNRRPIDYDFVQSIFTRDHPGTADPVVVKAFADSILALDSSMPTGTYVDMCVNLPILSPAAIKVPTLIMRGEFDGIASFEDVAAFFAKLPNPDKQLSVMPGIAHASLQEKNFATAQHVLQSFFSQPPTLYKS
jgi:pimeloyl-ACP methyl ester carboxylesterase